MGAIDPMTGMPINQGQGGIDPLTGQPQLPEAMPQEIPQAPIDTEVADNEGELLQIIDAYGVDENTAMAVLQARRSGFSEEEILDFLEQQGSEA